MADASWQPISAPEHVGEGPMLSSSTMRRMGEDAGKSSMSCRRSRMILRSFVFSTKTIGVGEPALNLLK
jgi:hypothetical protein